MLHDQPPRPANMESIVAINQGRKPYTLSLADVPAIPAEEADRFIRAGHLVLDTRPHELFGRGHVPGAFNMQFSSPAFEQNAGWLLPLDRPVLMVADTPDKVPLACRKLAFVGLDQRVTGVIDLGAWGNAGMPLAELPQIDVQRLHQELEKDGMRVLDVREAPEWKTGHIPPAVHVNFKHLPTAIDQIPFAREAPIAVVCAAGMRSSTACSFLVRNGYTNVHNVTGGMNAWRQAGLPTV